MNGCYLEIKSGVGGEESLIFVKDLYKMYKKYAELKKWKFVTEDIDAVSCGIKEVRVSIIGSDVYDKLLNESGGHRVQRVPSSEKHNRIHTSSAIVAVLPTNKNVEVYKLTKNDMKIDTYRSSGPGGQHVNTTNSAIRITHKPTGICVEYQNERSQYKNKVKAMSILGRKISYMKMKEEQTSLNKTKRMLFGTGRRNDRCRTYNFPNNRITDHRLRLTFQCLLKVMGGDLDRIITHYNKNTIPIKDGR